MSHQQASWSLVSVRLCRRYSRYCRRFCLQFRVVHRPIGRSSGLLRVLEEAGWFESLAECFPFRLRSARRRL